MVIPEQEISPESSGDIKVQERMLFQGTWILRIEALVFLINSSLRLKPAWICALIFLLFLMMPDISKGFLQLMLVINT